MSILKVRDKDGEFVDIPVISGRPASIKVGEVKLLESNSEPIIENVGTEYDAIFNFGIPRGLPGNGTGTFLYPELFEKPKINDVELNDNVSLNALGIQPKGYYTKYVDDVAKLQQCKPQDVVRTLGYYEPNDGGGALYLIREKTENDVEDKGSIHFVGDELVAELITNNEINVKQFGAKGDGISDDTESIQNAIEYVKKLKKKSHLNLNKGTYIISTSIEMPLYIKLISLGIVTMNYIGDDALFHLYNDTDVGEMKIEQSLHQMPFNIGNVLDGSKGVLILRGTGKNNGQIGIKLGEETLGERHVTSSAWCNFSNIYIENFSKGLCFTNIQNYIQRFYNVTISHCNIAISNSDSEPSNSGELITFNMCSINNNQLGIQINHVINFNFVNCSIDYNKNGIELNWQGYYTLNLDNCWLEGNNEHLSNDTYLIKSNVPSVSELNAYSLPIVNMTNCLIYPIKKSAWKVIKGKMRLNINNVTIQCDLSSYNNVESQFLCDDEVVINSFNGLCFIENTQLLSKNLVINKNFDFSNDLNDYDLSANTYGNSVEISTDKYYTGTKSMKVIASDSKYVSFETAKFNVSRIKKILGNVLLFIDSTNEKASINANITVKFFDKDDVELTNDTIVLNRDYNNYETQKFVLIPNGISKDNAFITVPNEAMSASVKIILGNLTYDIYIDNVAITGL